MGYDVSPRYVDCGLVIVFQCWNDFNSGGEVPRLVAVEGQVEEDGRYVF